MPPLSSARATAFWRLFRLALAVSLTASALVYFLWTWRWPLVGDASLMHYIAFLTERFPRLSRQEAYMIASIAVDYHVTQMVDGTKGIHGMIPKAIFAGR